MNQAWIYRWLSLILVLTLLRGMLYLLLIPPWQSPDETGHFEYVWTMTQQQRLPTAQDQDPDFEQKLLDSLYTWRYGTLIGRLLPNSKPERIADLPNNILARRSRTLLSERFSLAYIWQAVWTAPFKNQELVTQLYAGRFSSVILNACIVGLSFLTFCEMKLARPNLTVLMALLIVFIPQHTYINSTLGDGPLAECAACLVIFCWARLFAREYRLYLVLGVVAGTLIGIWSKNTSVFLILLDVILTVWLMLRRSTQPKASKWVPYLALAIPITSLILWIWSRSPLGMRSMYSILSLFDWTEITWIDQTGLNLGQALVATYESFWAHFGWMTLPIGPRWYGAIHLISLAALVGSILLFLKAFWPSARTNQNDTGSTLSEPVWPLILMGTSTILAGAIFGWTALLSRGSGGYFQIQGRYLFPVIIPFAFLFIRGLDLLFSKQKQMNGTLLLFGLITLDMVSVTSTMLGHFYGAFY